MAQAITAPGDVDARAESDLSDPRVRLHHRRRRHPPRCRPSNGEEFLRGARAGGEPLDPEADRGGRLTIRPTRPRTVATSISTRTPSRSPRSTTSSSCPISPMRSSISTTTRRPRCCRCRAPWTSTVEFTSLSKTYSMPGWRMGFAVGNERLIAALARVKSYLDYGAFTPIQVAAAAALNGPQDCVEEMRADLQAPPRRAGRKLRPRRLGHPAAAGDDVCLGADPRAVPRARLAWSSPSC